MNKKLKVLVVSSVLAVTTCAGAIMAAPASAKRQGADGVEAVDRATSHSNYKGGERSSTSGTTGTSGRSLHR